MQICFTILYTEMRRIESHFIAGPAGRLEALLEEPEAAAPRISALVCHPHPLYGGTMHNKVVYRVARGLRRAGAVVLPFNFRGVNRSEGEHGHLAGEIEDARTALAWLRGRYPGLPFALAGFSFGARVVVRLACSTPGTSWLLAAGLPTDGADNTILAACAVPKVFVQSTRDQFGPRDQFEPLYAGCAPPKQLIWIDAADHFFAGALDALEEQVTGAAAGILR